MPREQFDMLVAQARREADSRSLKAYFPLYTFSPTANELLGFRLTIYQICLHWSKTLRRVA